MLVRSGSTTVGDIEALAELLPQVWEGTPLRVLSFIELIGITGKRTSQALLDEAAARIHSLKHARSRAGLSPHASYTTLPELLRLTAASARRKRWRVAIHVAECALEYEMFTHRAGLMFDWIQRSGRDMSDCGLGTPVEHICRCGLTGGGVIAVHANYLGAGDASLLARHGVHVAHCPRSHFYFRHAPFPLRRLLKAGVNICLGTDSLASVYKHQRQKVELSMFDEMRALAGDHPWLRPGAILQMATVNGALALGMRGKTGELAQGAFADMIVLPFSGKSRRICEHVVEHRGPVSGSLIDGSWAIPAPTL
jgi:cytosine/adenosine deaminase-related metal-dependent hydrolase